ncbi:MAG TPA: Fis family transcriptional regulator, partial [Planctomycetes bacterium]|nr:Fis family transcriptional regulator [Planctomycetota bacterium]
MDVQGLTPQAPRSRAEELLLQTRSPTFRKVVETCLAVAPTRARVLLLGETGTGKEVLARAIHGASGREGPFVAVNCAAVSKGLMQAELFGHERGAFTGALNARAGLFQQANGGTLFLDEIGDMPLSIQAATLRVLEEGTVRPVGSTAEREVDVRVLAATSVWLEDAVSAGQFREDLLYRLDV